MSITLKTDTLYCDTPAPPDLNTLRGGLFDEAVRKFEKERKEALKNWQEILQNSISRQIERDQGSRHSSLMGFDLGLGLFP